MTEKEALFHNGAEPFFYAGLRHFTAELRAEKFRKIINEVGH